MEVWGIFNFETFEWRCSPCPTGSVLRYGSSAVWLPPYLPFLPSFEVSSIQLSRAQLTVKEKRSLCNTSLSSQFFWLLQQGRRPADNIHTILLIGGYDREGTVTNEINQITVTLPPAQAPVSSHTPRSLNSPEFKFGLFLVIILTELFPASIKRR